MRVCNFLEYIFVLSLKKYEVSIKYNKYDGLHLQV